ncbi:TonB-dependent receptor [Ideonella sp.]|uniref:TonB-dependent receptor n=1 Tax=Ideonella sp. TaxID=1929293 RepID=UPI0035B036F6
MSSPSRAHPGATRGRPCGRARQMALVAALQAAGLAAHAQGVATDTELQTVTVTGQVVRNGLARHVPSTHVSKTAEQLREQNLVNPEDALRFVPNTTIRKRYAGDRNALIGGRSFGTLQPSRGLAYVDGYLISNFLGRFDAPRWHMATPEAMARVDVLYGPFSALYPGNSIGTTVAITERQPTRLEGSARLTGWSQSFREYGHGDEYGGHQASAFLGWAGEAAGRPVWASVALNRQVATSQPMQYLTVTANAAGEFPAVSLPPGSVPARVTGVVYDRDPKGARRAVLGAGSGAIEDSRQHTAKLKLGVALTPDWQASAMLGGWDHAASARNVPFLRDAAGATVWSGPVTDGTHVFAVPATAFAPTSRDEAHRHGGLTVKSRYRTGWNTSVVASAYRIDQDVARQALTPEPQAAAGGAGTATHRDGTGWHTLEWQAAYTPQAGDWGGGHHAPTMGLHRNGYRLDSPTHATADWRDEDTATALSQRFRGRTAVQAVYLQDVWSVAGDLKLTLGWRHERFQASDGEQLLRLEAGTPCVPGPGVTCEVQDDGSTRKIARAGSRRLAGDSPKASIAWTWPGALDADGALVLKLSAGRGVRFPNVEELYNGTVTATSATLSDPHLRAERADAVELSAEHDWERHRVRVSLFRDEVSDAILRQSEVVGGTTVTRISNVDRVRTHGVEVGWQAEGWLHPRLTLDANAAWADARVTANSRDPAMVGRQWLRVPRVRANLLAAWRPAEGWMGSVGVRHAGRAYNDPYNLDTHPNVYGGVSSFTFVDLRGSVRPARGVELALGVDNATDARGYQAHPYPGRTVSAEVRVEM